jgi:hypothetical protein
MLKTLVKSLLPAKIKVIIGRRLIERRERELGRLPLQQAFDEVYRRGMWKQGNSPSGLGSEGILAERYVDLVRAYAAKYSLRTAVDGGCGDFSVGSRLVPFFERYAAIDVSPRIIASNQRRYADLAKDKVTFAVANMLETPFPATDLVLIREVLQHLTNAQIEMILKNLEASTWRRVLISESVYDPRNNQSPNLDLPSHSVRTRGSQGSGVFVDKPPFSRPAKRIATLYPTANGEEGPGGLLILELSRDPPE